MFRIALVRLRIGSFETAETVGRQRIGFEVVVLRRRALALFVLVAVATAALDLQFSESLTEAPVPAYLEERLHLPDENALRDFAAALAVAVAAVTAILMSISLVVLENAGQRYGGRLIRYLLAERVTTYVMDLLLLTLLLSIWTLGFVLISDSMPFVTIGALSLLVLLSFLSLPVYRQHALGMLVPRSSVDVLGNEISRMVARVPLRENRENRSISAWLRRNSEARLADLESLIEPVLSGAQRDVESAGHIGLTLLGVLGFYGSKVHRIRDESGWFPTRHEAIAETDRFAYLERRRMFEQLGFGRPTQEIADRLWFERRVLTVLRVLVVRCFETAAFEAIPHLLISLEHSVKHMARLQASHGLDELLALVERMAESFTKGQEGQSALLNYASSVSYELIRGIDAAQWCERGTQMRGKVPDVKEIWKWRAPARFEQILLGTRDKLVTEETLVGRVVTPESWLRSELAEELERVRMDVERRVIKSCIRIVTLVVEREEAESELGAAATYGTFRLWHQWLLQERGDLEELLPQSRVNWAAEALFPRSQPPSQPLRNEWATAILDEVASCCFLLILQGRLDEFPRLVDLVALPTLMSFETKTGFVDTIHRLQAVAGLSLLTSEIRQDQSAESVCVDRIARLLADDGARWQSFEDRWKFCIDPTLSFSLRLMESLSMKYHHYFLRAWQEIRDLGERSVTPDALWRRELDHPSEFLRRYAMFGTVSPNQCAEEFLERLLVRRPQGEGDGLGEEDENGENRASDDEALPT